MNPDTSPIIAEFPSCVCDHTMTAITCTGDGDHKQFSDATIRVKRRCCFHARPLWPKYS